jgi:hypothetical protein
MKLNSLIVLSAFGLGACDGCGNAPAEPSAPPQGEPASEQPAQAEAEAEAEAPTTATLIGVVRLAEGAALPSYAPEQMEKRILDHAERGAWPADCTPPKTIDRQPVRETESGALTGVLVAASDFSEAPPPRPQQMHRVAIRDCRLEPRLLAAVEGDVMRVQNEVDYPFMPAYGNDKALRTLTPGQKYDVELEKAGVNQVLCGFTAPCGRTDVIVLKHPLHAVTGEDGAFRIEGLPAGEQLTISAWHPLFQAVGTKVQLEAGEEKRVELVIAPAQAAGGTAEASGAAAEEQGGEGPAGEEPTTEPPPAEPTQADP